MSKKIQVLVIILAVIAAAGIYWFFSPRLVRARELCKENKYSNVYLSGDYIKLVSNIPGGGETFYPINGGESFGCPVVGPEYISAECKNVRGFPIKVCSGEFPKE